MGSSRKEDIWSATEKSGDAKGKTKKEKTPGNAHGRSANETFRP